MNKNQVLVASFIYPHEAVFVKGTLENNCIPCYITNDQRPIKNPYYACPITRKRLFIEKENIARALAVFDQTELSGHFTILLNESHLKFCNFKAKHSNPDQKICRVCACVYVAIIATVLFSLLSSLSIF